MELIIAYFLPPLHLLQILKIGHKMLSLSVQLLQFSSLKQTPSKFTILLAVFSVFFEQMKQIENYHFISWLQVWRWVKVGEREREVQDRSMLGINLEMARR